MPEIIFGDIPFYSARREPCIICGHPTGDCAGDSVAPIRMFGVSSTIDTSNSNAEILVEHDIIEETQITPFTKAKVLVARAGTYVSAARAKELGII